VRTIEKGWTWKNIEEGKMVEGIRAVGSKSKDSWRLEGSGKQNTANIHCRSCALKHRQNSFVNGNLWKQLEHIVQNERMEQDHKTQDNEKNEKIGSGIKESALKRRRKVSHFWGCCWSMVSGQEESRVERIWTTFFL